METQIWFFLSCDIYALNTKYQMANNFQIEMKDGFKIRKLCRKWKNEVYRTLSYYISKQYFKILYV